jgi:hypothetical protein
MTLQNPAIRRISQLIKLLSSEQAGEAAAAAAALNRTLTNAGLDIHDLAKIAETGLKLPLPSTTREPQRRPQSPSTTKARRPDGSPLQMDQQIVCDQPDGLFRPCGCGSILFTIMPGVGPHVAQLVCNACDRGGRWLSRAQFGAT